jgi:hypothetical protein
MKRFFFDEENEDEDDIVDNSERSLPDFIPEFFTMSQQENLSVPVLNCAVRICEQSLFWRFFKISKKVSMIQKTFSDLMMLVETEKEQED